MTVVWITWGPGDVLFIGSIIKKVVYFLIAPGLPKVMSAVSRITL